MCFVPSVCRRSVNGGAVTVAVTAALRCTVWLYYVYDPDLSAIAEQATICTCGAQHDLCVRMRACVRVRECGCACARACVHV
jgi:hypothetical protein